MPTAVLTDRERTAVQACLRPPHTVPRRPRRGERPAGHPQAPVVVPPVLAEAETALARTGLTGHEETFFRMLRDWHPEP
ncbi:hypothetical protein [Streptomyces sp. TE5632]